ncbi:alpha/beta hydrolase [Crocosphaera sp. XPORK-15E]|uniref:alpha/beta fold hydrolase n=1 Tax=Crocosphaera sp. XPORK-15E TaxID=3110247 RepID=UPI002B216A18|nr:alpha/beta hydrolase [Crocosphaera sp. XPORK-15E]MEA5532453.1 alpha/beta hydrolase [Crocosphaera sp. XPORK-15E]
MNLHVTIQGQGYPILCLHGHPGAGHSLSVFTDHLSQRFLTISPDLRGYGKSRYHGQFEMLDHLTDLINLLDNQKIDQCLLLGWSLGGILALELILRYPERFTGLILIASAARPWSNHPRVSSQELIYSGIAGILNYFNPGWQWNINTFGKRSLFRYLIGQQTSLAYQYLAKYGVKAYLQTSKQANQALSNALKSGYNRLEDLHQIEIPCLVLAGSEDRHITAISSQETAQKLSNSNYICYPDTAHLFPWEIPQQVLTDIDDWLVNNFIISHLSLN